MKKVFVFLSAVVFLISGCSFDVHVITPAPVDVLPTVPSATPIIFPPSETPVIPTDTPVVGFTPEAGVSLFYGAHAVENPTDPTGRYSFLVGTKRIYVVWYYQNMHAGLTIRREWYLNGRLWLQREEPWDFSKYGAFGAVQDVSIYDDIVGLPTGVYQLQIFIDGLQQPIGADTMSGPELWLNFAIQNELSITETTSPVTSVPITGDLGFGNITGHVVNASTGLPIANATVTCEHFSYTSKESDRCNRRTTTDQDGGFLFENIFFHDTDSITLIVEATGYETARIKNPFFTWNEWKVDISLKRAQ
jgi:hypothetical protein